MTLSWSEVDKVLKFIQFAGMYAITIACDIMYTFYVALQQDIHVFCDT